MAVVAMALKQSQHLGAFDIPVGFFGGQIQRNRFVAPKTRVVIVRTGSDWGSIGPRGWNEVMRYIATHIGAQKAALALQPSQKPGSIH
jgi:hypothetical protein